MHKAAMEGNSYLITYLKHRLDFKIDDHDIDGNIPLHYACYNIADWASVWLIGFGSKVDVKNTNGDSPLHMLLKSD
jgi:ankyrin repeat protein